MENLLRLMEQNENTNNQGILQKVMGSQQKVALREFSPQHAVLKHLGNLEGERELNIIASRYGLNDGHHQTLEEIGKRLNLTRERVRQIEKDGLKKLKKLPFQEELEKGANLIFQVLEEHGGIMREDDLLNMIVINANQVEKSCVLFLLNLSSSFNLLNETASFYRSWRLPTFDQELFDKAIACASQIIRDQKHPLSEAKLFDLIRAKNLLPPGFNNEALESMIGVCKQLDKNPFGEWGLSEWLEIHPKDVGDKAFLVLEHHGKPEHYAKITELINVQKFDQRTAYKETVHNELIKDERFVLVGRGIYALKQWGYERGAVGDIIEAVLTKGARPLSRDEIINEVLKQRIVKKNTVIVGLANKKRFKKNAENKYALNTDA